MCCKSFPVRRKAGPARPSDSLTVRERAWTRIVDAAAPGDFFRVRPSNDDGFLAMERSRAPTGHVTGWPTYSLGDLLVTRRETTGFNGTDFSSVGTGARLEAACAGACTGISNDAATTSAVGAAT